MKTISLETDNPSVHLVEPELERDAQLGIQWIFKGDPIKVEE